MKKGYQRTPRNFDGTDRTSHSIEVLLPNILQKMQSEMRQSVGNIAEEWNKVIGEKMAPMTEVLSVNRGVVTIKVKGSTLYSLLCQHEKQRLLRELQKRYSKEKIRDLCFRIG